MKATIVWMVSARTGVSGRKGTLSLEQRALVFRPASTAFGDNIFPLTAVKKVRRTRGSPVLEIRVDLPDHPGEVAFYFVSPPDLTPREDLRVRFLSKRSVRRDAITKLRQGNARKREEVQAWADAIERARPSVNGR